MGGIMKKSVNMIIEEQIKKWQMQQMITRESDIKKKISVITVSREPGSGGILMAEKISGILGFELINNEIVTEMVRDSEKSKLLVETLDERGFSMIEDWISAVISEKHLWPDEYMQLLLKIVLTISKHGNAVIVGRGANYIIPKDERLSVRIISPLKTRVKNVSDQYEVSRDDAMMRIKRTEANRHAFVKKYFYTDISDPVHYDLVINSEHLNIETGVEIIKTALRGRDA
jgi:cytidylate kinase